MISIKIKKIWLRDPVRLLEEVGAIHGKRGFPNDVYVSRQDYKYVRDSLKKELNRQHPNESKKRIETTLGFQLLNYGPNESLLDAIKPGYVLVDKESIARQVAKSGPKT